jgi:predicted amidophosphoribosyltransferase
VEHSPAYLSRSKPTHQQAKLHESQRWSNVRDAFNVPDGRAKEICGKRILLVDDIVTTGATIYEASKPLLAAGAVCVDIFSLAYAK